METANPQENYLTTDHLGSPRVITDRTGNVVARRDFMPFGEELGAGVGTRSITLNYAATGTDTVRKRFTGYEKDQETQLDFAEARMYQNKHGRFTAVDPLMASASPGDPQTFNRYVYTGNNPINRTDSTGLCIDANTGKDNKKPCANHSGSVYVKDGTYWNGPVKDGQLFTGDPTIVNSNGATFEVTRNGWTQIPSGQPVQSQAAQQEIVNTSSTEIATEVTAQPIESLPTRPSGPEPIPIGRGGELDYDNAEGTRTTEGAIRLAEGCSMIPGLGAPCGIIAGIGRGGQGNLFGAGSNLVNAIPFMPWLRRADTATDVVRTAEPVFEGIYEFVSSSGKVYVGQSGNIAARIQQHIASGKLLPEALDTVKTTAVLGGKRAREVAEQLRINDLGGIFDMYGNKVLENIRNPIGEARKYLLP